jgi:hypothetical protein
MPACLCPSQYSPNVHELDAYATSCVPRIRAEFWRKRIDLLVGHGLPRLNADHSDVVAPAQPLAATGTDSRRKTGTPESGCEGNSGAAVRELRGLLVVGLSLALRRGLPWRHSRALAARGLLRQGLSARGQTLVQWLIGFFFLRPAGNPVLRIQPGSQVDELAPLGAEGEEPGLLRWLLSRRRYDAFAGRTPKHATLWRLIFIPATRRFHTLHPTARSSTPPSMDKSAGAVFGLLAPAIHPLHPSVWGTAGATSRGAQPLRPPQLALVPSCVHTPQSIGPTAEPPVLPWR